MWAAGFCVPRRSRALVVSLHLAGLFPCVESVVCLEPEWGAIVCAEFLIEKYVPGGVDFHLASGWIPGKFTVVGV